MRIQQHGISKFLALALIVGLCITPEMFAQQTQSPPTQAQPAPQAVPPATSQPPASAAPAQTQPAKPSPNGTNIDPSQAPLQPVTTYPDATDQQQAPSTQ